jgi:DNA polymerase-4
MSRTVLFAEVPCFYAAVERSDDPTLIGRPIIIGGNPRKRGLVQGASPEALAAGVSLDQPVIDALQHCPEARAIRTNMRRYREVSRQLQACLRRVFDQLEPFGLGAAYFDLTGSRNEPEEIALRLQAMVDEELGLAVRAGIASGKLQARMAAEEAGWSGCLRVEPGQEAAFLGPLLVTRLEGVGEKTAASLAELGVTRIGELLEIGRERLQELLGTHGLRIHTHATGIDERPVRGASHPQSVSREVTVEGSVDQAVLSDQLEELAQRLEAELRSQGLSTARITLKARFVDRSMTSRSQTLTSSIGSAAAIHQVALRLLDRTQAGERPVRGLGIQLARLQRDTEVDRQLDLFPR